MHEVTAFGGMVRKEWQLLMRYWPDTFLVLAEAILMPLAYWAQAEGFEGNDPAARAAFADRSGTDQIAAFIYLGWAVFMWVSTMIWGPGASLRQERMQGSLETLVISPVSRFTLLYGPAVAHLMPTVLVFSAVAAMLRFVFGVDLGPGEVAGGIAVLVLSIPAVLGLSALVSVVVMRFRDSNGINAAARGLVGILCGVTYPLAVLPGWIHPVSWSLPITAVIDSLRAAVLGAPAAGSLAAELLLLVVAGVATGALGVWALGASLRTLARTGRLGQY
jgi:ABC-2 type transport system permease protein